MNGKWSLTGELKPVYESDWMTVETGEVTLSDDTKAQHHFVRSGEGGAAVLVEDPEKGILLIWRHRLVPDEWGWELPGGRIEAKETAAAAAAREFREETGWEAGPLTLLTKFWPLNSFFDHAHSVFTASSATWVGPEPDQNEVGELCWMPLEKVKELITKNEISDGFTLTALLRYFWTT